MRQEDKEREEGKHVRCYVIDFIGTIMEPQPASLSYECASIRHELCLITLIELSNRRHCALSNTGVTNYINDGCFLFACSCSYAQVICTLVYRCRLLGHLYGAYFVIMQGETL